MGQTLSMLSQFSPPKPKFTVDKIPDLSGKVCIVTGGNTGIGKETIKALLQHNAKVYMASRSKERAEVAIKELKETTEKDAIFLELDLASLESVKKAAEEFLSKESELHILFNNAGVMWPAHDQLTKDGYDLQFGANVLGHFYFTELLMPALLAGAQSSSDKKARIVYTSSIGHYLYAKLDLGTLVDGPARKKLKTEVLYNQSKFGDVIIAREFARRYGDKGIVSASVNPGNLRTELQRHAPPMTQKILSLICYPAAYGALTQLYAGTSPETVDGNGKFFIPWAREGKCDPAALDSATGEKLWDWCQEQVNKK